MPAQLTLHLGHRAAMTAEDFLVADCNAAAVGWIDRWPDWGATALVLYGPSGCGKTHLAQVWRARSGAPLLKAAAIGRADPVQMLGGRPVCVIEGADEGVNELALLHLFNVIAERRGSLLLTARNAPKHWAIVLPDLASRIAGSPAARIDRPDDALLAALASKLFADRQMVVPKDVIDFLVTHGERSFAAMRRTVDTLDERALAQHRPITLALARDVLQAGAARGDNGADAG